MTDEMIALARRAVACKGWRWLPGMKLTTGLRITESLVPFTFSVDLPDLTDPATLGCLLALVREAWGDPALYVMRAGGDEALGVWHARWGTSSRRGATEAEALVVALESAP